MMNARLYEEQILKELKALPEEALPKVLRLITLVKEEFFVQERQELQEKARETTTHERTQQLLATSSSNWAQELITEREDRL